MSSFKKQENYFLILIILIYLAFALQDIFRMPVDLHQFRQTQTLSTIRNFQIEGINLLEPKIDTNGRMAIVILEFPIYQAIVAFFGGMFGNIELLGRLLNIFATLTSGILFCRLIKGISGCSTLSMVYLCSFLLNPSMIFWSSVILVDPFALSLILIALPMFEKYRQSNNFFHFLLAVILVVLATLIKITVAFIPLFFYVVYLAYQGWPELKKILVPTLIVFFVLFVWYKYSSNVNKLNPHEYTRLNVEWYLGSMSQRLNSAVWRSFWHRFIYNHLGVLVLLSMITSIFVFFTKRNYKYILWVVMMFILALLYLLIFINLNFIHTYYQLPINWIFAVIITFGFKSLFEVVAWRK